MAVQIITGDCRQVLATLPAESVHCVVTSPPYWGLRDYGVAGQIGLEPSYQDFVAEMVAVFREVRRVLRADGTLWLNLGDSYCSTAPGTKGDAIIQRGIFAGVSDRRAEASRKTRPETPDGLKPKDLCGIPWRVAFALQAPDYLGRIRNEADRAWMAALIDGEGCISILETKSGRTTDGPVSTSYPPVLQVRMCDPECIEKAMRLVGSESDNPAQYPPSMEGQRPAYQWRIHGRKAADTIAEIYPFLLIKRKQAIVAWNHQAVRDGYETKRGVKIPTDALEKQKLCREIIQKLNQRETVDLPSWMIQPPLPVGPGWYLRQDVIWSKPNPMPESVTDRCTKAHEYVFLLSKSARYYFDADAIREECTSEDRRVGRSSHTLVDPSARPRKGMRSSDPERFGLTRGTTNQPCSHPLGRNRRSVWEVATTPFSEAHFATFPPSLIEPCILAGCPEKCCPHCGSPWMRQTKKTLVPTAKAAKTFIVDGRDAAADANDQGSNRQKDGHKPGWINHVETLGFEPTCACPEHKPIPGTCFDPFGGAGTTGLVADRLQRNAILVELNPEYAAMARRRVDNDAPLLAAL